MQTNPVEVKRNPKLKKSLQSLPSPRSRCFWAQKLPLIRSLCTPCCVSRYTRVATIDCSATLNPLSGNIKLCSPLVRFLHYNFEWLELFQVFNPQIAGQVIWKEQLRSWEGQMSIELHLWIKRLFGCSGNCEVNFSHGFLLPLSLPEF